MAHARRSIARGVLFAAALMAASCLGCPPPFQNVNVRSDPPGADVFLDGVLVKQTPVRLEMSTLRDHKVFLKKDGYRPELVVVERKRGQDGVEYLSPPDIFVTLQRLGDGGLDRAPTTPGGAERPPMSEEERERRLRIEIEKKAPGQGGKPDDDRR
jgi:hypothetical protein